MIKRFCITIVLFLLGSISGNSISVAAQSPEDVQTKENFWMPLPTTRLLPVNNLLPSEPIIPTADSNYHIVKYRTYERGLSIRVVDINKDGWDDVIFVTSSYRIRIWLQKPQCHELQEWQIVETEILPFDLEIADLNNDGELEIIVIGMKAWNFESEQGYVQIFSVVSEKYSSDGVLYPVGIGPRKVAVGDVTGDDKLDILVTTKNVLDVLIQQLDGSFLLHSFYNPDVLPNEVPNDLVVDDFNNDNLQDVAIQVANRPNSIIVYYQENGTLLAGIILPWPSNPGEYYGNGTSMTAGDITGDGKSDLVAIIKLNSYAKVVVYAQNTEGGFSLPKTYDTYDLPTSPNIGDMNNDNRLDLLLMNDGFGSFTIHYQALDGSLSEETIVPAGDVQSLFAYQRLASLGDVTGDGKLDVVYLGINDGLVVVTSGNVPACPDNIPPRLKIPFFMYSTIDPFSVDEVTVGDVNGNGFDEVLALVSAYSVPPQDSYVQVIESKADGSFVLGQKISMGINRELLGMSVGDIDNDNRLDISTVDGYSGVYLALQNADGGFGQLHISTSITDASQTYIADWTGDGLSDLAVIGANGINVFAQKADHTLSNPVTYVQGQLGRTIFTDIVDWNNDGRMDIVAWWRDNGQPWDRAIRVFLQNQAGGFTLLPPVRYDAIQGIATGDINSDSKIDIVVSHPANIPEARLGLVYQLPDGTLADSFILSDPKFSLPGTVTISDLNFDGLNDLLVLNTGGFGITAFTQNQLHTFDAPVYYEVPIWNRDYGHSIAKLDTNKDGKTDVFAYATGDDYMLFLKPVVGYELYLPFVK